MIHYSCEVLLKEVCDSDAGHNLPTVLVEITATVLDQEVRQYTTSIPLCVCVFHCAGLGGVCVRSTTVNNAVHH